MKRSWMVVAAVVLAATGLALSAGTGKHKSHKAAKAGVTRSAKVTSSHKAQTHVTKAGKASAKNHHGKASATAHKGQSKASSHATARAAKHTAHKAGKVAPHKARHAATAAPAQKTKANAVRVQRDVPSRSIVDAPMQPGKGRTVTAVAQNKPTADLKSAQLAMTGERLIPLGNW